MRNTEMAKLEGLVGEWTTTISDAWFLEPPGTTVPGHTTVEWLGDSLLVMRTEFAGHVHSWLTYVLGRSDATDQFVALYQDDRGVCRQFAMTVDDGHLVLSREDPDMHQRLILDVEPDRMLGRAEASDDAGDTWRKDFDLTYERAR